MDGREQQFESVSGPEPVIRDGWPSEDLVDSGGRSEDRGLKDVPDRIMIDIARYAGRNALIKVRSRDDYEAVNARFGFNPNWEIVHEPGLGHYVMIYPGECCS